MMGATMRFFGRHGGLMRRIMTAHAFSPADANTAMAALAGMPRPDLLSGDSKKPAGRYPS